MPYTPQEWVNNSRQSPVSAARLSHMETQHAEAMADVEDAIGDPETPIGLKLGTTFAGLAKPLPKLTLIAPNDSISRQNFYESGTIKGWSGNGYLTWLNAWLGARFEILNPRGAAVPGNTTAQILARLDADVLPYEPGVVVVMAGTNDVAAGLSAATITANLEAIYDKLRGVGALVVACTILPRDNVSDTDAKRLVLLQVNAWIKAHTQTATGVILADTHAALANPFSGKIIAGVTESDDGIHPNYDGAHAIASALYRPLAQVLPVHDDLTESNIDPTNLLPNGRFANEPGALRLSGVAGSFASVPDFAAIPRGTFSIAVWFAADDWTPGGSVRQVLLGQHVITTPDRSFFLRTTETGLPNFTHDRFGDATVTQSINGPSAVPFIDGQVGCLVVTRSTASTGSVQFATSAVAATASIDQLSDLAASNLGAAVTGTGTWDVFNSAAPIEIGSRQGGTVDLAKGRMLRAMIFDAAGNVVLDADFTNYEGAASFPDPVSGETITMHPGGWGIADGWVVTNGAGNVSTVAKVPRTDGVYGAWQQIEVTASTTAGNTTSIAATVPTSKWAVGDILEFEVEVEVDDDWEPGAGGANFVSPNIRLVCTGGAGMNVFTPVFLGSPKSNKPLIPAGHTGLFRSVLRTPAAAIPSGTTAVEARLQMGSGAKGTARFDRARVRKVSAAV